MLNSWLQDGICSWTDTSPGAVSQGNALQPGCVTACPFGEFLCSAGAAAPHLCSAPGLCWAQGAVSKLMVPALLPLGWRVLPVVTSVCVPAFRDSLKHLLPLARSWLVLPMWIQPLFIFKSVQKHLSPGFCSCTLWLLFRCSSTSLHLCSLSCHQK